jgi:chitosanase
MKLSTKQKSILEKVINVFESGSMVGNYAAMAIFADGPNDIRQITYGRSQTTEYGNLRTLVQKYVAANGLYSKKLKPYAEKIGTISLTDDAVFKDLLKKAGKEDAIMRKAQDDFFDQRYYSPAIKWAKDNGFILPLSGLIIYDSFIHSGSILWTIRGMFAQSPPNLGGNEIEWTTAYVNARQTWLANHHREAVRKTIYRTQCFKNEIAKGNWMLNVLPISANGVKVS